jgi:two-component system, OmpR family, sensor histidine kinase CreC
MTTSITSDTFGLFWGGLGFLTFSYALSRAFRGLKHGYSIRLQLFFTLFTTSMLSTTLIGVWAINRIEARAATLFEQNGLSAEVFEHFFRDFGAKTGLILGLLTLIAAGGAWALGRGLASPIERLASAAENITAGGDISSLPQPPGREVRRLRESIVLMHEALEDRRQFEGFIADLSHDLKNPVAAIKASVEVLQSGAGEDKQARERFLQRIDEASIRLNLLLSDFLGLARLEVRGIRFDRSPFSALTSLKSARQSLEGVAQLKNIQIETPLSHIDEGAYLIHGSHRWLTRAFENVLSNALKFSPNNSTVWIDWGIDHNQDFFLLISDEGPGVPDDIADNIFVRFVSKAREPYIHSSASEQEGTGLGLAIVKQVIEAHKGSVLYCHETNIEDLDIKRFTCGAQFLVTLPLVEKN